MTIEKTQLLSGISLISLLISSLTLLFFACFFSVSSAEDIAKALACHSSDSGQYELAERFYKWAPDLNGDKETGRYSSMATWHTSFTTEDQLTIQSKNTAVAKVYGESSREMAGRYFYVGLCCSVAEPNQDKEALYWFEKAFKLYERNHAYTKCTDTLAQMSVLQHGRDEIQCRWSLLRAKQLEQFMDEEPYPYTFSALGMSGTKTPQEAAKFADGYVDPHLKHKSAPKIPTRTISLMVLLWFSISGFGSSLLLDIFKRITTRHALRKLLLETDKHTILSSLNTLTTFSLVEQNIPAADRSSRLMLKVIADEPVKTSELLAVRFSNRCNLLRTLLADTPSKILATALVCSFFI